jgi:predicted O-methyltransferase YrrM
MGILDDRMMALDNTLQLHNEGEWNGTPSTYTAFNSGGVESEVGEFLYGFLRMIKPEHVLETGTHLGVGASYMGMALKDNFRGMLETIEYIPEIHHQAKERITKMGLNDYVKCYLLDVKDFPVQHNYQFIFLDTEPQTRFAEFVKFYPYLDEGGYMFIHDLGRSLQQVEIPNLGFAWPFGPIPGEMEHLLIHDYVRPFYFSTPRGLTGFYKTSKEDYVIKR